MKEVTTDTTDETSTEIEVIESNRGRTPQMSAEDIAAGITSFDDLPLSQLTKDAVRKIGWSEPTPVQKLCLPHTLRGRHVAGFAQTGTGKTGVFLITIANRLLENRTEGVAKTRAIVLAPTRELAMQIEQDAQPMFDSLGMSSIAVFGGIDYDKQAMRIKEGVDVIFATPGRLKDYCQKKIVNLSEIELFVCDEADRMFDMGFIDDVEFFLEKIPEESQKLLFSATTNDEVKELAFEYLENPEYISVTPEVITPEKITQRAVHCNATEKLRVLLGLMREHEPGCAIVFTNTKLTAEWLHYKLMGNGIEVDLLTGDLPQKKRIKLIQRIKEGQLKALIATDVASRGLHISKVTHVYNFDLPDDPANYVHRIGRTARAGASGNAWSLVCDDYGHNMSAINEMLGDVAVTSEWPKPEYLAIQDQAGNPYTEGVLTRERQGASRRDGGRDGGRDRGGRDGGRGRDRGGRDSEREGRGHEAQGDNKGRERNKDRKQHAEGRDGGRPGQKRDDRGGRGHQKGPRPEGQRDRHGKGGHKHDHRKQHDQHQVSAAAKPGPAAATPEKSLGGMIKKLFKAIFG
jgi:ATP-dependent RNA helicase RhlB